MYGYSKVPKSLKEGLIDERKLYVTSQFLFAPRVDEKLFPSFKGS
jgi:hypothetical protein